MPRLPGLVLGSIMTTLLLTLVNILSIVANIGLLAITIKVYSECLKVQHIKAIGKKEKTDSDAVVR